VEHATGSWDHAAQADIRHIEQKVRETSYYTKPEPTAAPAATAASEGTSATEARHD
jgi:hypothetical protein